MGAINIAVLVVSALLVASIFTSLLSFRIGAPLLLVFLFVGLSAGEDGLGIVFNDAKATYFIGSIALAIILFDSGFHTRMASYRQAAWPAITLASAGVLITVGVMAPIIHYAFGFDWLQSLLLGAIISSTDAAAVFFLLRSGGMTLRDKVRSTLEIESGSNDPMAIVLTISLVELIAMGPNEAGAWHFAQTFLTQMIGGGVLGIASGLGMIALVNRLKLDPGLYPVVVLALALLVFAATNVVGGSGFLAVYIAGLITGNANLKGANPLRRFQSGLAWLGQIVMFVTLGLLATPSRFLDILIPASIVALALIIIARPLAVWLCLRPFRYTKRETAFIGWLGLRGAVSILLALAPLLGGVERAQDFFDIAFVVVIFSLILQGWTIQPVAKLLGMMVPAKAPPIQRFEVDLPGLDHYEMVRYVIQENSPVAHGLRIPRWARPALVRRDGVNLTIHNLRTLKPGDQVFLFTSPANIPALDKLFGATTNPQAEQDGVFGDFFINGTVELGNLSAMYGIEIGTLDRSITLAQLFAREFPDIEPGDRITLGGIALIAHTIDENGNLIDLGLALEPGHTPKPQAPILTGSPMARLKRCLIPS